MICGIAFADDGHFSKHSALRARGLGYGMELGVTPRDLPWPRTLFLGPGVKVPWDLISFGFGRVLDHFDVAAPFTLDHVLASEIGSAGEREVTSNTCGDLRQPTYSPDLVLVRNSAAGIEFLKRWRTEETLGSALGWDRRLAFLRARIADDLLFAALPCGWLLSEEARKSKDATSATPKRVPVPKHQIVRRPPPMRRQVPAQIEARRLAARLRAGR